MAIVAIGFGLLVGWLRRDPNAGIRVACLFTISVVIAVITVDWADKLRRGTPWSTPWGEVAAFPLAGWIDPLILNAIRAGMAGAAECDNHRVVYANTTCACEVRGRTSPCRGCGYARRAGGIYFILTVSSRDRPPGLACRSLRLRSRSA